ncbi:MAG: helix-turn-helix domain-containing protein [Verrucomicrobiota bacterium]|nr:helix-turn-helix domain-containing protein [Verrucomicrobiota bacterium]
MKNTEHAPEVNGFVKVYNKILYDPRISYKAKGVYAYIISKPVGWRFNAARIASQSNDGRKSVLAGIHELIQAGYIVSAKLGDGSLQYRINDPETPIQDPEFPNGTLDNPQSPFGTLDPEFPNGTVPFGHGAVLGSISNTQKNSNTDTESKTHARGVISPDAKKDQTLTSNLERSKIEDASMTTVEISRSNEGTPPPREFMENQQELLPTEKTTPPGANALIKQRAEEIYRIYPRHVGKGQALRAISRALQVVPYLSLKEATQAYAEAVSRWPESDRKYVPHCSSWMNAQRWTDDRKEWERVSTGYCPRFAPSTDNDTEPSDF